MGSQGGGPNGGLPQAPLVGAEVKFQDLPEARHGILCEGVLLYLECNNVTIPRDITVRAALSNFDDTEILKAKQALFSMMGGENTEIGKFTSRQDRGVKSKKAKDLDDIIEAMDKLRLKNMMPVLVATSGMVLKNPPVISETDNPSLDPLASRIKNLEQTVGSFIQLQTDQMSVVVEKLSALNVPEAPTNVAAETIVPRGRLPSKRPRVEDEEVFPNLPTPQVQNAWSKPISYKKKAAQGHSQQNNDQTDGGKTKQPGSWRYSTKAIYGAAKDEDSQSLVKAAPVSVVAFGLAKDATAEMLKGFVTNKGLEIISCELLTKFEGARTNSFKVTFHAKILKNQRT